MILLVDDHGLSLRALVRAIGDRPLRTAASASSARVLLAAHRDWTGFFIDVDLPEGPREGLALLSSIRQDYPLTPAAIVTGLDDRDVINGARALDADVIVKGDGCLAELIGHTLARIDLAADPIASVTSAAARRVALTDRESQMLDWLLRGGDVASFGAHAGIAERTCKDHQASLLRKTGYETRLSLVAGLPAEALCWRR